MAALEKQVGGGNGRTREAGERGAMVAQRSRWEVVMAGLEKQVGGGQWQD